MKKGKNLFKCIIMYCVPLGIILFIVLGVVLNRPEPLLDILSKVYDEKNVSPVLYFEENMVSADYDTHTFLIEGEKCLELEKHYRTYSKTYPSSVWDQFGGSSAMREHYGQLLNYYHCRSGEIYVFDRSLSQSETREYIIKKGTLEALITYSKDEYYFDFLYFDGYYYFFTFAQTETNLPDYDLIRVHKLTDSLVVEQTIEINFSKFGLLTYNFINNSVAAVDGNLYFPVKKDQTYYLLRYNSSTDQIDLVMMEYGLLGTIADTDCFYVIGFTDDDKLIFETLKPDGTSVNKNIIPLPMFVQISQEDFRFDDIYYMYNSEIYCCLMFGQRCCFLSYDILTNEWKNSWTIAQKDYSYFLMEVKYMIHEGGAYFDLFPNWNNSH